MGWVQNACFYWEDKIVNLRSKNNHSFNRKFPAIKTELEDFNLNAILDGELVVLNEKGLPDFNKIMSSINTGTLPQVNVMKT